MRCESCQEEITFSMALRQAVPHRFRCLKCNARYRVKVPHLWLILLGIVAVFGGLAYEFILGMRVHGPSFILPYMIVAAAVWLFFEFLLHRHITMNGQLIRMDADEVDRAGGDAPTEEEAGPKGDGPGEGEDAA